LSIRLLFRTQPTRRKSEKRRKRTRKIRAEKMVEMARKTMSKPMVITKIRMHRILETARLLARPRNKKKRKKVRSKQRIAV
jgi:hypothetical protein